MHLVLEVESAKAVESTLDRTVGDLKENLMDKRVRFKLRERTKDRDVTFEFPDVASRDAFDKILKNDYPDLEIATSEMAEGRGLVSLKIRDKRAAEIKKMAVEQSLETIRNRVDQFGITEPEIIPQGTDRIIVQLPGIKDTARAKNLIGRTALLEFKLVDEEHSLDEALKGNVPEGSVVAYESRTDRNSGRRTQIPLLLKSRTLLTGDALESAKVQIGDRFGEPHVSHQVQRPGGEGLRPDHRGERQETPGHRPGRRRPLRSGDPGADLRRPGPDHRLLHHGGGDATWPSCFGPAPCPRR